MNDPKITAQFPYTTEVFKPAYKMHLKRRKLMSLLAPVVGVFMLVGSLLGITTGGASHFQQWLGAFMGCALIFYRPLIIALCVRRMKQIKFYGDTIISTFSPGGFTSSTESSEGRTSWKKLQQVVFSRAGILIYPQEGVFYFTPRNAFASDAEFEAAKQMIVDAGVKVKKV
jgi:hypothetical protein